MAHRMSMKLTYIHHSSFLLETESASLLFDYTEGEVPQFNQEKPLYIFSTHRHGDHFSPKIFALAKGVKSIQYLLSFDIPKENIPSEAQEHVQYLQSNANYEVGDLKIRTFKSTDEGIALVIETGGKTLYYAGDLNHWHWDGEPDWWNLQMAKDYLSEVEKLPKKLDIAFVPVDPRLNTSFSLGSVELLAHAEVTLLVPMHFWGDFSVCEKLQEITNTKILQITHTNQSWRIS